MKSVREKIIETARRDAAGFIENFVKIEEKDEGQIIPFRLWKEQKEAIETIEKSKLTVILKARQLGISWLVISYAVRGMIARPGYTVLLFSQGKTEAMEMIRRAGSVIMPHLRGLIGAGGIAGYKVNADKLTIIHPDGRESTMTAFATTGKGGRGFTADLIIFDEWATHQFAEELYKAAIPTINRSGSGKFIGLSTMKRGTLFEDVVVSYAERGFSRIFIPWYADPKRDDAWYKKTREILGDMILQEYPATVEEALLIPGGAFFPEFDREIHVVPFAGLQGKIYYISMDYGLDMLAIRWTSVDYEGNCQIYREFDMPNLIVSEAARELTRHIAEDGAPQAILAPPDMWNRETQSGRSRADIFRENGVDLMRSSSDIAAGCSAIKELLYHEDGEKPRLTLAEGSTAKTEHDLEKIQKDEKRPDIYAKEPHELTHAVDAVRYFAVWYIQNAPKPKREKTPFEKYRESVKRKRRR